MHRAFVALAAVAALVVVPQSQSLSTAPIAFASDRAGPLDIYVTDRTGDKVTQLTRNAGDNASPSWSPDGQQIAFTSSRSGRWSIWEMNADGTEQHQVTTAKTADTNPVWSPDGKTLAFTTSRDGNWEIYVMPAAGGRARNVTRDASADDLKPTWSPDSATIVFERVTASGRSDLYRVDARAGGTIRPLFLGGTQPAFDPAYSPDGARIAFDRRAKANYDVWVMNADGTGARRITTSRAEDTDPTWSPDGTELAFTSTRDGDYEVYVTDLKGAVQRDITRRHDAVDFEPAWSRAGTAPGSREPAAARTAKGGCTAMKKGSPGPYTTAPHLYGTYYADTMCGTVSGEWLSALKGYDTLFPYLGRDYAEGGPQNDKFYSRGDGVRDVLYGGTTAGDSGTADAARLDLGLDVRYGIENPNL